MSAFGKRTIELIFGNKKYLRFDEDHEKLLTCLELSDIERCDNEDDEAKNENGNADGIREDNVEEQSEINAENFNEEDLEIQSVFDQWGRRSWKKTDGFQPVPEDSSFEQKNWKVLDYSKMYFDK
ncbi:hypothetical protein JTB14_025339 [Gonioctena quinquepunctata]|nr:hypothetical protein JTB14_025339 [Gonioctena quinquepunctata]